MFVPVEGREVAEPGDYASCDYEGFIDGAPLRAAFVQADGYTHTNRFIDMHDVGDMLIEAGFADPVMDMEQLTLTYAEPRALLEELKAVGASNATRGRPRGLTGRARWQRMLAALERLRRDERVPATFEIIYGHAWKGEPKQTAEGHAIVKARIAPPCGDSAAAKPQAWGPIQVPQGGAAWDSSGPPTVLRFCAFPARVAEGGVAIGSWSGPPLALVVTGNDPAAIDRCRSSHFLRLPSSRNSAWSRGGICRFRRRRAGGYLASSRP